MDPMYRIDPSLEVPIYQQLVDTIRSAARKGELTPGQKLPTVQEMADGLSIARGTIKRAYDELERIGLVEKVQGRGTFVRNRPQGDSRKDQAMAAIDETLDRLERMGFSPAEINIFLNLKLRERAEREASVKVAVVDPSPELLRWMAAQLGQIEGVEVYSYLMDAIRRYPYQLGDELELVVCTPEHAVYLQSILPPRLRLAQVALRPRRPGLHQILSIPAGSKVGILGVSSDYAERVIRTLQSCELVIEIGDPMIYNGPGSLPEYLRDKDTILLPEGWEMLLPGAADALKNVRLCPCAFKMDEGSMLYLQAKIKRLLDAKTI